MTIFNYAYSPYSVNQRTLKEAPLFAGRVSQSRYQDIPYAALEMSASTMLPPVTAGDVAGSQQRMLNYIA